MMIPTKRNSSGTVVIYVVLQLLSGLRLRLIARPSSLRLDSRLEAVAADAKFSRCQPAG